MAKGGGALAKAAASDPSLSAWQRAHVPTYLKNHPGYKAPAPLTIQQQAQQEIDPIIQALTDAANQRAATAEAAIKGLTSEYAQQVGGINYGAPYASAEGQQAAVDSALQQALTGHGSSLASGLSSRLSQLQGSSGQAAVDQASQGLASQGASSGNTALAGGSAALSNLIAHAASANTYGEKQPGIVKLAGLQMLSQAETNAQNAISAGTLSAEQQLPAIIQQLKSDQLQAKQLKLDQAYKAATLALNQAKAAASVKQGNQRLKIESFNAKTSRMNANTSAARAAQSALNEDRNYRLALARLGISKKNLQLKALTQEAKLKSGGLSASEVSRYRSIAYSGANAAWDQGASYRAAMQAITAKGVPISIAMKALSRAGFKPGVRGTPLAKGPKVKGTAAMQLFNALGKSITNPAGGAPFQGG